MTAIRMPCTCKSETQDNLYGQGIRIHNLVDKGKSWRCTVCGKTITIEKR